MGYGSALCCREEVYRYLGTGVSAASFRYSRARSAIASTQETVTDKAFQHGAQTELLELNFFTAFFETLLLVWTSF
jgi:hypothetical protein